MSREEEMNEVKRLCADCKTNKTPLWRSGPHGPRSLCNACGIRYRKRKMANENPSYEIKRERPSTTSSSSSDGNRMINESITMRLSDVGKQITVQRTSSPSSQLKRQRSSNSSGKKRLGEVEQAAVLLMSLSCGSVLA